MTEPELREQIALLAPAVTPADAATLAYLDSLLGRAADARPAVAQRLLARAEARVKTALAARKALDKTAQDPLGVSRPPVVFPEDRIVGRTHSQWLV